jgi:hypothetical protein
MIRTSRFCKDAKDGKFLRFVYEDARTVYEAFRRGAKESSMLKNLLLLWKHLQLFSLKSLSCIGK